MDTLRGEMPGRCIFKIRVTSQERSVDNDQHKTRVSAMFGGREDFVKNRFHRREHDASHARFETSRVRT